MSTAELMAGAEFVDDPYPLFRQIRETDPVHFIEPMNAWLLTRYEDVKDAFNDDRLGVMFEQYQVNRIGPEAVNQDYFRVGRDSLVCNDPPIHTEMRKIFRRAFTLRRVKELQPTVHAICAHHLDQFAHVGRADIVADYSYRVPLAVISSMLGVPEEDQPQIADWVSNWAPVLEVGPMSAGQLALVNTATRGLEEYFHQLLARRRTKPGADFVSEVLEINSAGQPPLDDRQLVANLLLLYFAGQDTQKLMFGNMIAALAAHPDQLALLAGQPERTGELIAELYRYDTVGQFMGRTPVEDIDLGGKRIRQGQTVMVCMGAANRDPVVFPEPDRLDLTRRTAGSDTVRHITFGFGRHHCLGAHLAQANLPIMLREVIERLPGLRVDRANAVRHQSIATRGYEVLPIYWDC